jgi:hypothetical protein
MIIDLFSVVIYSSIAFAILVAVGFGRRNFMPLIVMTVMTGLLVAFLIGTLQDSVDILKSAAANESHASQSIQLQPFYDFQKQRQDICDMEMRIRNVGHIYSNATMAEQKKEELTKEYLGMIDEYDRQIDKCGNGCFHQNGLETFHGCD